jgi:hypothetical protein
MNKETPNYKQKKVTKQSTPSIPKKSTPLFLHLKQIVTKLNAKCKTRTIQTAVLLKQAQVSSIVKLHKTRGNK